MTSTDLQTAEDKPEAHEKRNRALVRYEDIGALNLSAPCLDALGGGVAGQE